MRRSRTRVLRRRTSLLATALVTAVLLPPGAAEAQLCPDVRHSPDPVELECGSLNERWAVIDETTGSVTNVVVWNGTNLWRPPPGTFARDLPDGSPVGPGWWLVDGAFVADSFERNVSARPDVLSVHLSWSVGGLGTDSGEVSFTVDVQPTGQQFTVEGTGLTVEPLEAGVNYRFTVTATRADGTTVTGPVVTATPQADPDPECSDGNVARECRAATDWAVVHPETGMVENVIVCTAAQCGPDGEWEGVMPQGTSWPGHLLIELTEAAGIGWQYVDGEFVDVRPEEDPDADSPEDEMGGDRESAADERQWAVIDASTGMVENVIVWDGTSTYDPGAGRTLVELEGRAGIGWQYVDGEFVDVRPIEEEVESDPSGEDASVTEDSAPPAAEADSDASAEPFGTPLAALSSWERQLYSEGSDEAPAR